MHLGSLEDRRARNNEIKLVTAALYEAKVKNEEILRVLMKVCNADREEATNAFRNEKFMLYPCRALYQYLIPEKGFEEHDADVIINSKAKRVLTSNRELSKLSPAKLYDAINK